MADLAHDARGDLLDVLVGGRRQWMKAKRAIVLLVPDALGDQGMEMQIGVGKRAHPLDRVLEAAEYIPLGQLGTTSDCGFSPFSDDLSTTRDKAFAKIAARVKGTALVDEILRSRV